MRRAAVALACGAWVWAGSPCPARASDSGGRARSAIWSGLLERLKRFAPPLPGHGVPAMPAAGDVHAKMDPYCPLSPDAGLEEAFNFGIVVPGRVLRSRAPSKSFLAYLKSNYALAAIVDMRNPGYKDEGARMARERGWAEGLGLPYVASTVSSLDAREQRDRVLRTLEGLPSGAVLVHCQGGKDRTGNVVALLRALERWSYAEALLEMRAYRHVPEEDGPMHQVLKERFIEIGQPLYRIRQGWEPRLLSPRRCPLREDASP